MQKNIVNIRIIFLVFLFPIFLFGCKHDTIEFRRDSAVTNLLKKSTSYSQNQKVNSGIIILKDEPSESNINFGPRDINFDMPMRSK